MLHVKARIICSCILHIEHSPVLHHVGIQRDDHAISTPTYYHEEHGVGRKYIGHAELMIDIQLLVYFDCPNL